MNESNGKSVLVTGRIVWVRGDLFKGKPKLDLNTRARKVNKNGEDMTDYGFGLAVPKSEMAKPDSIWAAIHEEAYRLYPSRQMPPAFAWKYKDGDGVDHNGAPFNTREGYAGHLVFGLTTSLPIKYFRWENGAHLLVNDGIKCGDYVNVQVSVKAHLAQGQGKPGLYLNPQAVQFLGYGKEIINMPSAEQIFGSAMPALPPGASAMPLAPPSGPPMQPPPGYPPPLGVPTQGYPPPQGAPAPQSQNWGAPPPPQGAPAPYYGVVPPAHQPPPGGQPMAPPPNGQWPQQPPAYAPQGAAPQGYPPLPGAPR